MVKAKFAAGKVVEARYEALPPEANCRCKVAVMDTAGSTLAGACEAAAGA